jgi:hypothetical protein
VFEQAIAYIKAHEGVRFFSSAEFAGWCLDHPQHLEEWRVA